MPQSVRSVCIGNITLAGSTPFVLIGGPCALENEAHARMMAEKIIEITTSLGIPYIFKASYDKANRSSLGGYRGPGMDEGLRILSAIKADLKIPVLTDIHTPEEVKKAAEVADILQVPAFLCRQTDLLLAAGNTGKAVNVKKGQFMAPWDMANVIKKIESTGNCNIAITERGTSFGYNNLVSDMRCLPIIRKMGVPVIMDATHSVQLPSGQGGCSGGDREMAHVLARAAAAAGIDGMFLEIHQDPDTAPCDGPNMIRLDTLKELLETILTINAAVTPFK